MSRDRRPAHRLVQCRLCAAQVWITGSEPPYCALHVPRFDPRDPRDPRTIPTRPLPAPAPDGVSGDGNPEGGGTR